jgi:putative FmdB family regulatory protein
MPRYDFRCSECNTIQEHSLPIDSDDLLYCLTCDTLLAKVFTAPAAHFKGGGWGGSHPTRTYKTRTEVDAGTGERGSQKTEEL